MAGDDDEARMCKANTELVPLKIVLFLWYGGTACLLPFLTVHMRQLGLSVEETAIIYSIVPFAQLLGPYAATFLGDKYGSYKCALLGSLMLTALSGTSLLLVPQALGPPVPPPAIHLHCGPSLQLEVVVDHCGDEHGACPEPSPGLALPVLLSDCRPECPDTEWLHAIDETGICFTDDYGNKECHVVSENDTLARSTSLGLYLQPARDPDLLCLHPVTAITWESRVFHNVSCLKHLPDQDHTNCSLKCTVEDTEEVDAVSAADFWHAECTPPEGSDRRVTISVYFLLRIVFQVLVSICFTLVDATTVSMVHAHEGRFAWQRFWAIVGSVSCAPLSGFFIDLSSEHVITGFDYSPAFYMFNVFTVLTAIFTYVLEIQVATPGKNVFYKARRLLKQPQFLSLFLFVLCLGSVYGFLEYFLFWYLLDLGAANYLLGLTISIGGFAGFLFLYETKWFMDKLGVVNIIALSGLVYCARLVGYSYIGQHPLWCILLEGLEAMTFHLLWVAIGTYGTQIAPRGLKPTVQSCVGSIYFGLGRSTGSLVGGTAMYFLGAQTAFRIMGAVAALASASYGCFCCWQRSAARPPAMQAPGGVAGACCGDKLPSPAAENAPAASSATDCPARNEDAGGTAKAPGEGRSEPEVS
ncbi:major facilitator superfamily domain-containing protein 6-like isoform X1 [Dermacentor andersoni]|uniref:major facilitator superfamily domain-containing protein 6-like isoform X1 n=2 Tax=Dermacentor andersoni TaxID=34620 RepID=UPI0024176F1A|nr:major facilitator superfamily domain-containing protein 6-like isoform X1 [Dermacentor andersoni]